MGSSRKAVVVQLSSGLGNQLFSYASGRGIAQRLGAELRFRRARGLGNDGRKYALCHFHAKVEEATVGQQVQIAVALKQPVRRVVEGLGSAVRSHLYEVIQDKCWGFTPDLFPSDRSMFLRGFWQSERYFAHIADEIRAEFEMAATPREIDRPILEKIRSTESVCVHVRRGDLITNPVYAAKNQVQDAGYYEAAAEAIRRKAGRLHFFVFSDDPDWPRENLSLVNASAGDEVNFQCGVATQGREDWGDFQLMRECKHFIIANSTFSWWAAWLGSRPGKEVVAPRLWFRDRDHPPPDLIPESWLVV